MHKADHPDLKDKEQDKAQDPRWELLPPASGSSGRESQLQLLSGPVVSVPNSHSWKGESDWLNLAQVMWTLLR